MNGPVRNFVSKPIGGEFGVSVELPLLQDVIDYEEGIICLEHGYPRFVSNRMVAVKEHLARIATGMPYALAFPSLRQAHFILNDFIQRYFPRRGFFAVEESALLFMNSMHPGKKSSRVVGDPSTLILVEVDGVTVACLKLQKDYERLVKLRRTWGSGFDIHKMGESAVEKTHDVQSKLKVALTDMEGRNAAGAVLFQSGMAAISSVMLASMYLKRRVIAIGSAYVDTMTIVTRWPKEIMSFHCTHLPDNFTIEMLDEELKKGPALIYFETPTNPKLLLPNVAMLLERARARDAFVVTDATIATPYNFHPLDLGFDIVLHSTTKFLSGKLNHLGGVAVSSSKEMLVILEDIAAAVDVGMCDNQAAVLLENLKGFSARMEIINNSGIELADRLRKCSKISKVYYPGFDSDEQENIASQYLAPGRSGVMSFILKDNTRGALRQFYDSVKDPVKKGPGLGGETSLLCPYIMMAHYHETEEFRKEYGFDPHLIRLSVGTEPVDDIWKALNLE